MDATVTGFKKADFKNKKDIGSSIELTASSRWVLVVMACVLCLPMVWGGFFTSHEQRSQFENRTLAKFPPLSFIKEPKQYFSTLDQYVADHMGFTMGLNRLYRKTVYYLFNESTVKNISVAQDGYVFLTSHSSKEYNLIFEELCQSEVSPAILENYVRNIEKINNVVKQFGHRAIFATAITKPVLYPERLPRDVSDKARKNCQGFLKGNNLLKQLQLEVQKKDIVFHYPFKAFMLSKNEAHFFPKENFHWNGLSAHLFARTFFENIGVSVGSDFDKGKHLVETKADLKIIGFARDIEVWNFPYADFGVAGGYQHKELNYMKQQYSHLFDCSYYEAENPLQKKDAIVFSDSFGGPVARHLATGYKTLTHFNIFQLQDSEQKRFYAQVLGSGKNMDIVFLFHDGGVTTRPTLKNLANTLAGIKPKVIKGDLAKENK